MTKVFRVLPLDLSVLCKREPGIEVKRRRRVHPRKLSNQDIKGIKLAHKAGYSIDQIAKHFSITKHYVRAILFKGIRDEELETADRAPVKR